MRQPWGPQMPSVDRNRPVAESSKIGPPWGSLDSEQAKVGTLSKPFEKKAHKRENPPKEATREAYAWKNLEVRTPFAQREWDRRLTAVARRQQGTGAAWGFSRGFEWALRANGWA